MLHVWYLCWISGVYTSIFSMTLPGLPASKNSKMDDISQPTIVSIST